jgi:hypothetical protein
MLLAVEVMLLVAEVMLLHAEVMLLQPGKIGTALKWGGAYCRFSWKWRV